MSVDLFESINTLIEREDDLDEAFSALINSLGLLILETGNTPEEVKSLLEDIVDNLNVAVVKNMLTVLECKKGMEH